MTPPLHGRFVTGLVVGLLAGLSVALAVALYISKAPVPFINKVPTTSPDHDAAEAERNKSWDPNAPLAGKSPAKQQPVVASPSAAAPTMAPMAEASPAEPGTASTTARPSTAAPKPMAASPDSTASATAQRAAPTAAPASANSTRDPAAILGGQAVPDVRPGAPAAPQTLSFFVQAGAYARTDDAEQQRAKLALMGLTARITEREQSGRTVYRVRLGPFDARNEAEDAQSKLTAAGIDANLVRVER